MCEITEACISRCKRFKKQGPPCIYLDTTSPKGALGHPRVGCGTRPGPYADNITLGFVNQMSPHLPPYPDAPLLSSDPESYSTLPRMASASCWTLASSGTVVNPTSASFCFSIKYYNKKSQTLPHTLAITILLLRMLLKHVLHLGENIPVQCADGGQDLLVSSLHGILNTLGFLVLSKE